MIAIVDEDACTGCGLCTTVCPEVFQLNDNSVAEVIGSVVPSDVEDACREAADTCPVEAITIEVP